MKQSRDVKMVRTATAQEHSSFMSVCLMNERSPFSLTSGKMVHSTGCFIDVSNSSQRRNKVSVRAVKEKKTYMRPVCLRDGWIDAAICDARQCG